MDLPAPIKPLRFNRWLPYWAVLQMDMRQMTRSWVFRVWILAAVFLSVAYLLHRTAIHHQAGIEQQASSLMSELLKFSLLIGTTLVIILTAGSISSEQGTMADSVLSRGISRYQYFVGKWHSRLATILGSYLLVGLVILAGSAFLLRNDLSFWGSFFALTLVGGVLAIIISCGITISSFCRSTVLAIAILWMSIYGVGVALYLLQYTPLNPGRLLNMLPYLLQGQFDARVQSALIGYCALISLVAALIGLANFARRDV